MFEFNREFIINNNDKGPLAGGKRFKVEGNVLKVGKMVNLEKGKIHAAYRAPYIASVKEVVKVNVADMNGTFVLSLGQEGRIISLVSDRNADHTKEYFLNGEVGTWQAQWDRIVAMEDVDRLIDVNIEEGVMTITAKDCYTRVAKLVYEPAATENDKNPATQVWVRKDGAKGMVTTLTAGTEGAGTVARILKNMRLLTAANINPYGFDKDERPIPGGEYDQFTVQYVSERRHQSGEVFGSINHSLATMIFFVESKVADAFATELTQLVDITPVYTVEAKTKKMVEESATPELEAKEPVLKHSKKKAEAPKDETPEDETPKAE